MTDTRPEVLYLKQLNKVLNECVSLAHDWRVARAAGVPETTLAPGHQEGEDEFKEFDSVIQSFIQWRNGVHQTIFGDAKTVAQFIDEMERD